MGGKQFILRLRMNEESNKIWKQISPNGVILALLQQGTGIAVLNWRR